MSPRKLVGSILVAVLAAGCQDNSPPPPTGYNITLRFFGPTMTAAQQALFTSAAKRIETIVTGDLSSVTAGTAARPLDISECASGQAPLHENIDDILIFATLKTLDGKGNVIGQASPCFTRADNDLTVIGSMEFDQADIADFMAKGQGQDVITHEMLHVLGVGTLWLTLPDTLSPFLQDTFATPRYTGPQGRLGCQEAGGTVTCANFVPVEGNDQPKGTRFSHWDDFTFGNELMTGFVNNGANPLSRMTIRSLADLGYTVNVAVADPYTKPGGPYIGSFVTVPRVAWEQVGIKPLYRLEDGGRRTLIRRAK